MAYRRYNPKRVKIHRCYAVEEIAQLFGAHKNTVRRWLKTGLQSIDARRPTLVDGAVLTAFIRGLRSANHSRCGLGEMYCLRCKVARRPAEDMADYIMLSPTRGNLRGLCPVCAALMHRCVSRATLQTVAAGLEVREVQAQGRIRESASLPGNDDFKPQEQPCPHSTPPMPA